MRVELAGVGLTRDRKHPREAHLQRHPGIELAHLLVVAVEQLEKARLRSGGPLDPSELQRLEPVQQLLRVEQKLLHPQGDALADGGELRRLEVGVSEAGHGPLATRQLGERHQHRREAAQQQLQALPHQHQIGVVGDVGAGRAEVEERPRGGRLLAEVMDVGHDVVA